MNLKGLITAFVMSIALFELNLLSNNNIINLHDSYPPFQKKGGFNFV